MREELQENSEIISLRAPKLDAKEKLYVKAYLSKLSHSYAHSVVCPDVKLPLSDNLFSKRENVKFHIAKAMQDRMEALEISPEKIIERMYVEATREGNGSNHSARIQALQILGKHLGIFQEKKEKEDNKFVFNIVSYGTDTTIEQINPTESTDPIDPIDPIETEEVEGIQLINYSDSEE